MKNIQIFWIIVGIISVLILINGAQDINDPDKKTAEAGQNEALIGSIGIASALTFGTKKALLGIAAATWHWIAWPLVGLIALLPNIFGRFIDIFRPSPTVPMFVWIIGGLILLVIVLKKK